MRPPQATPKNSAGQASKMPTKMFTKGQKLYIMVVPPSVSVDTGYSLTPCVLIEETVTHAVVQLIEKRRGLLFTREVPLYTPIALRKDALVPRND